MTASLALPLPSNHTCTSRRAFPIRVRQFPGRDVIVRHRRRERPARTGLRLHDAPYPGKYVYTTRRTRARRLGAVVLNREHFRAFVDLRGFVRGRYAVRVTAVTADGRVLVATRRYRTCSGRLTGTIPRL